MALEALEAMPRDAIVDDFDRFLGQIWQRCIECDEELWRSLLSESTSGINEERLEQLMKQTLLYSSMHKYLSRPDRSPLSSRSAQVTLDAIDSLIQEDAAPEDSVFSIASRQLFHKTLHLAHEQ